MLFMKFQKLVKKSPRCDSTLQNIRQELSSEGPGIRVLCPTRWTVHANALHSIMKHCNRSGRKHLIMLEKLT